MTEPPEANCDALPARLIVCETAGRWAVALRRALDGRRRVYETRSVAECWEMLAGAPASFLVVELTAGNIDPLLEQMARLQRDFPLAQVAVVARRDLADYQWLIREAGAVAFTLSPRRLETLADVACRHLDHAPIPRRTVRQQIWATLPWRNDDRMIDD